MVGGGGNQPAKEQGSKKKKKRSWKLFPMTIESWSDEEEESTTSLKPTQWSKESEIEDEGLDEKYKEEHDHEPEVEAEKEASKKMVELAATFFTEFGLTEESGVIASNLSRKVKDLAADSLLLLGPLLLQTAHRLSSSMLSLDDKARCAKILKICLDLLNQPDHLIVRAFAHEQFARLLLDNDKDPVLTSEVLPAESEAGVTDTEGGDYENFIGISESIEHIKLNSFVAENDPSHDLETIEDLLASNKAGSSNGVVHTVVDRISSKLAAIHHASQAIRSLRLKRQLQSTDNGGQTENLLPSSTDFPVCPCGEADCIEVCNIRKWLPMSKLDDKSWKLVLLLGESCLALGEAYKDDRQLPLVFKVVELACLVYGSMPQHLGDTRFVSSFGCNSFTDRSDKTKSMAADYLFWAKAWTLVGDVKYELSMIEDVTIEEKPITKELKMSLNVLEELKRLKKKLGKLNQNCSLCSLVNCSCQSDRASSGSSESSSSGAVHASRHGSKQKKKSHSKSQSRSSLGKPADGATTMDMKNVRAAGNEDSKSSTLAETNSSKTKVKNGGIFKYLHGRVSEDADHNLIDPLSCYENAIKALGGHLSNSSAGYLLKKKALVYEGLCGNRISRGDFARTELVYDEAVYSFKRVSDHLNVIVLGCHMGYFRRVKADNIVSKIGNLKINGNSYVEELKQAKLEYGESIKYYGAARDELKDFEQKDVDLEYKVYSQCGHAYFKLGELLAANIDTDTDTKVYNAMKKVGYPEISAQDAFTNALNMYESLGQLCKEETTLAYSQLANYQKDCCLTFVNKNQKDRVQQYFQMARMNWIKSTEYFGPKTNAKEYLIILTDRSKLTSTLKKRSHKNVTYESALDILFEGCNISKDEVPSSFSNVDANVYEQFKSELHMVLKEIYKEAMYERAKEEDLDKLKKLCIESAVIKDFRQLHTLHKSWIEYTKTKCSQ